MIVLGAAIGALNGFLVSFFQVPSFALTLGTLGILQTASLIISDKTTVYAAKSALLTPMFGSAIGGLVTAFWTAVIIAIVLWAMLRFTLGRA